jgi:hypothetical protein
MLSVSQWWKPNKVIILNLGHDTKVGISDFGITIRDNEGATVLTADELEKVYATFKKMKKLKEVV